MGNQKMIRRSAGSFLLMLFSVLVASVSVEATGTIDPGFFPVASKTASLNSAAGMVIQSDGKPIIWGADYVVDGVAKGQLVRLNSDGTLDNSFTYCGCLLQYVTNAGIQPDGKILVAGVASNSQAQIVRLNADGSADSSYISVFTAATFQTSTAELLAIQPDGKVLASVNGSYGTGYHARYVARTNLDGSADTGFTAIFYDNGRLINGYLRSLGLDPNGKIYLAITTYSGPSSSSALRRFNIDGTADSGWETPNFLVSGSSTGVDIQTIAVQSNGSVVIGGRFDTVNGIADRDLVRLMLAGNVDLGFTPAPTLTPTVNQVAVLQSGKLLVSSGGRLIRLNSNGSMDPTFVQSASVVSVAYKWTLDTLEQVLFFGQSDQAIYRMFRLMPDGAVDSSFNPNVTISAKIYSLARQANGKIIAAGDFTQIGGTSRAGIARLNPDGTLDMTFDPGTGFNVPPSKLVVQADDKILAYGEFSSYNGTTRSYFARLNAGGSLDTSFNPTFGSVSTPPLWDFSLQTDQKILIAGSFNAVNSAPRTGVARLNSDGSLDTGFNTVIASSNIFAVVPQADGKIMIGGSFTGVDGFNRSNLVRLSSTGSLDQTFNAGSITSINSLLVQPDGKYLCLTGAGSPSGIIRRNTDGTADTSFVSPTFTAYSSSDVRLRAALLQADGSIIIGGNFDFINSVSRHHIVRITSTGSLDRLFLPIGFNGQVRTMISQTDGKFVAGGEFTKAEGLTRAGIARIIPGAYVRVTDFDFDGDGKSDISVFRPSENKWYILRSSDFGMTQQVFAIAGDIPAPADYDGDGRTDMAIFRPSSGDWWSLSSVTGAQIYAHWGASGDIPRPSDFDGDGRADYVAFRPSANTWYRMSSANGTTFNRSFGLAGDKPVTGDFDGDGKSDVAIYRPSDGNWWWQSSVDSVQRATKWGIPTDIAAPADFDGDGKTDFAVFRPETGVWYIINSSNGSFTIGPFGLAGDKPVPADYDGDGKADIAVFRPSDGIWYLLRSTAGFTGFRWGASTDIPVENAFVP